MEKNKKENNIIIYVLIGIIICLVIALVFLSYDKFIGKNNISDSTITLNELKEKYQINKGVQGQFGIVHESIVDKKTNKTIISNLQEFNQSNVYLLKSNGKVYFYVEGLNTFDGILKSRLYDERGKVIFDISDKYKFHLIYKDGDPNYLENAYEVDGAYYTKDGVINKYNLDGKKISSSKKYDEVIQVEQNYSLIYQSSDDSIYVVSNTGDYQQKITKKGNNDYCLEHSNFIIKDDFLNVYMWKCSNEQEVARSYYELNLTNNVVTFKKVL